MVKIEIADDNDPKTADTATLESRGGKPWVKPVVSSFDLAANTEGFGGNPGDGFTNLS